LIFELRNYWVEPSLIDQYLEWANNRALPVIQGEFGGRLVGFWRVDGLDGTVEDDPPNVIWMLAWKDRAERDRVWGEIRASASWARGREGIPTFHRRPGAVRFLTGIPRSPLQ